MNTKMLTRKVTRDEVIAAIKGCAEKLGHTPSLKELKKKIKITQRRITKLFGTYSKAVADAGLKPRKSGFKLDLDELFTEWAQVVRQLGRIPTLNEYAKRTRRSTHPLTDRMGSWRAVPAGFLRYVEEAGVKSGWEDVLEVLRQSDRARAAIATNVLNAKSKVLADRPVYGESLIPFTMAFAPTNEQGVVSLFSAMALKLGFVIAWIGTTFPDCEAFRLVSAGRWQRTRIEFEFMSRNFAAHAHDPAKCDLIVCWENNWPESPLEVLELKQAVSTQQSALSQS